MIKKNIPNFITLLNLLSGCIGILLVFQNNLLLAAYCIFAGAIFDFFDGFAARLLNAYGEMGKQLDSLADAISFGLLPGFILYKLLENSGAGNLKFIALSIPVFAVWRLAKFNIDTRQTENFIGLPTPANGLFIASLLLLNFGSMNFSNAILGNTIVLIFICISLCFLMVSELSLFSLKFKNWEFKSTNIYRYILILLSIILLIFFKFVAIPLSIIIYIILSIILSKNKIDNEIQSRN